MFVTVDHIEKLRPDIWTFWVRPQQRFHFIAGQYIELFLPHAEPDNRGQHRWLTISSAPHQELLALTTKFVRTPSTYKKTLQKVRIGDHLHISDPIGDFVLPKMHSVPVVLIAAGIGVTPMHSMVVDMIAKKESLRPVQLIHAGHSMTDLLFTDIFQAAPIAYHQMLSAPEADWPGLAGHLSGKRVLNIASLRPGASTSSTNNLGDTLFFLSGPESLIMKIHDELISLGVNRQQIVLDYFPGYRDL